MRGAARQNVELRAEESSITTPALKLAGNLRLFDFTSQLPPASTYYYHGHCPMLLCCSLALWFLVCFLAVTQYLPPWLSLCWVLLAAGSTDPVLLASGIQSAGRRTTRTLRCRGSFSVERELMPYGKYAHTVPPKGLDSG